MNQSWNDWKLLLQTESSELNCQMQVAMPFPFHQDIHILWFFLPRLIFLKHVKIFQYYVIFMLQWSSSFGLMFNTSLRQTWLYREDEFCYYLLIGFGLWFQPLQMFVIYVELNVRFLQYESKDSSTCHWRE